MVDERTIRDAYDAIAATAVSPERVLARIEARGRAHRQRRWLLAGAGMATAAAAVGVPLSLRERRGEPAPIQAEPSPSPPSSPAPRAKRFPLLFAPTWLPGGIGEQYRSVKIDRQTGKAIGGTRCWLPPGKRYSMEETPKGSVTFTVDERIDDNSGEPVMVGGVRGTLRVTDAAYVEWKPEGAPTMIVSVYGIGDQAEVALRIAESVRATGATTPVTMWSPEVPERFAGYSRAQAFPTARGWHQSLSHVSDDFRQSFTIVASLGAPPEGTRYEFRLANGITVYVPEQDSFALGDREILTGSEARRALEQVVCLAPDLSWVR